MIGFSPKLYPNELFYSFVARYHEYSLNQSPKYTSQELFGHAIQLAVPDLPINLSVVSKQLNTFMRVGVNDLIQNHTFFYFYTNFITADKKGTVRDAMTSRNHKGAVHMITGVMASGIKEKPFFYFCFECHKEDLKVNGETYWHLPHQLPGVFVCPKHDTVLYESNVRFRSVSRNMFIPATNASYIRPCIQINEQKSWTIYSTLAKQCTLLSSKEFNVDLQRLQEIYKILLRNKGYLSSSGYVNQKLLAEQFISYYGKEVLKACQSTVHYEESSCWLKALTRKHRKAFHPIRHVLFIHFLGESLESIHLVTCHKDNPFGNGPYFCLNKAAEHYGKPVITDVAICSRTKQKIGTFKCECGFHYTKREMDQGEGKELSISRVKQFGDLWINTVKDMIHQGKMSYRAVANILEVDTGTVIKYAKHNLIKDKKTKDNGIIAKKKEWMALVLQNEGLSVTQLRNINKSLYMFLYRNDKQWLKEYCPKIKRERINTRIDWNKRDYELKMEIHKAVTKLLNQQPLKQITISSVGAEVGKRNLLQKHLEKLPISKTFLNNYLEDTVAFQIRRVRFTISQLNENYKIAAKWRIIRAAGLKKPIHPKIEQLFEKYGIK
ncbi:TnsD family transposase [Bacillus sp. ISL-41]|uniref:TnsD family Tn7-like transposition protein n=1 Tax=Bacillus sp. ISL-41 TaxID=2819127 RepID=UPI001BEA5ED6|nr:TnsD family Tn7-like transposition protein [Bacillus sp. ISL-41]MBT2644328.1 TnsD family transposase [Bacillus sp. ISL-41]